MLRFFRKQPQEKNSEAKLLEFITRILGKKPTHLHYYKNAFIHSSKNETDKSGNPVSYERLEFLGDSILGAVVTSVLFEKFKHEDEGFLTKMRSKMVSRSNLNTVGKNLDLLSLVKSNIAPQHKGDNIYGNVLEALIGAIYLDQGYLFCKKKVIQLIIKNKSFKSIENQIFSHKSLFIEWCHKQKKGFDFLTTENNSKQRGKTNFKSELYINKQKVSEGSASSKKKAEENAAKIAYLKFIAPDSVNKN